MLVLLAVLIVLLVLLVPVVATSVYNLVRGYPTGFL